MRSFTLLALCAAAAVSASASAQTVNLVATRDGKPAGSATFEIQPGPNHSYSQSSILKLNLEGKQIELVETVKIDFGGATLESDSKEYDGGKLQKSILITFNTREAVATDRISGKKTTYPVPPGSKVKDPAELWFISIRPNAGSVMSATEFDSTEMAWQQTTRTYVSDVPVTLHGLKVMGHELKDESAGQTFVSIVDDHGLPYSFEIQGIKFVRK